MMGIVLPLLAGIYAGGATFMLVVLAIWDWPERFQAVGWRNIVACALLWPVLLLMAAWLWVYETFLDPGE